VSAQVAAIEELYRCHRNLVFGYLLRRCSDRELAADLTQDTFVNAAMNLTGFSGGSETAWLLTISRNLLIDHWKKRRVPLADESSLAQLVAPESGPESVVSAMAVRQALGAMPERDRRLLVLVHVEGFSHQEVAAMTGAKEGTIRMATKRARDEFTTHYQARTR